MTDTGFPFPQQGEAAPAPAEEVAPAGDNRRKMLLLGAVALVVVMAAGYFLFLRGGSTDTSSALPVVHHKATAASTVKKPVKSTIPQTFNGTVGRDPLKPLVTVVPVTPAVGAAGAGSTSVPAAGGTTTQTGTTPVALQKVYKQGGKTYAQLTVSGAVYAPTVGQTFAQSFQLLSVSSGLATLVQGDEQFTLKVGQVVLR